MYVQTGLEVWSMRDGGEVVVRVVGELDFATVPKLIDAIRDVLTDNDVANPIMDFSSVSYIDTEAIKAIILLNKNLAENGIPLQLRNCNKKITRIIDILGVADEVGLVRNEDSGFLPCTKG